MLHILVAQCTFPSCTQQSPLPRAPLQFDLAIPHQEVEATTVLTLESGLAGLNDLLGQYNVLQVMFRVLQDRN